MKMKKWLLLTLLLSVIFVTTVSAQEVKDAYRIFHGNCGNNVAWELDSHGVLTISGAGEMKNNQYDYRDYYVNKVFIEPGPTSIDISGFSGCEMREITIADTVTVINGSAFKGCRYLEELVIPDSVTWIGWYTFQNMTSLKHIQMSGSITEICPYSFAGCESLTTIVIPEGVTSIGEEAFAGCTNLQAVVLPSTLKSIDEKVFDNCPNLWHIFYTGSRAQWGKIQLASDFNDGFQNVKLHFDCTGNELEEQSVSQATCTAGGRCKLSCTLCGESKTVSVNKRPHIYQYACHGLCLNCGTTEEADHNENVGIITKEPTCVEEGIKTYTCKYCGETREEVEEISEWHTYDNKCDPECNFCGHTRDTSHKWDEGVVTREATCGEEGVLTYTCTRCQETKEEAIAVLTEHTYDHGCDADCNICGQQRTVSHVPGEPATETTDQVCTECGMVLTPATGPAPTEPTQPTQPTEPEAPTTPTTPAKPEATQPTTGQNTSTAPAADPAGDNTSGFVIVVLLIIGAVIGFGVLLIVLKKKK